MTRNTLRNTLALAVLTATAFALPRPAVAQGVSSHLKPGPNIPITPQNQAWAWGDNTYGELGDGTMVGSDFPIPVFIPTYEQQGDITALAAGAWHSLAATSLNSGGYVWAWGGNFYGALGNGSTTNRDIPVQVLAGAQGTQTGNPYLSNIMAISAGFFYSLALDSSGQVWAWGDNRGG